MSAQEAYDRLLPTLQSYKKRRVQKPNYPVDKILAEAKKVCHISKEDKKKLVNAGLNPEVIDTFEERIDAFTIASARYVVLMDEQNDKLDNKYQKLEESAKELRRNIIHAFRFAYRDNKSAINSLGRISKGRSRMDMIFDFVSLIKLAEVHPEELNTINFDLSLMEKANFYHKKLNELVAKLTVSPKEISEVKKIRNNAYDYMNESLQLIKEYGQFVFWKDEERKSLYKREYLAHRKSTKHDEKDSNNSSDSINSNAA